MVAVNKKPSRAQLTSDDALAPGRRAQPIKWWAGLGAASLAFEIYLVIRWITSGNFRPTPGGPDEVPLYMEIAVRIHEALGPISVIALLYLFIIKPWKRERRIPLAGVCCCAGMTVWWQDLANNWAAPSVVYNNAFVNFGSWYNFIPGWISPRAQFMPEPLLWEILFYPLYFSIPPLTIAWVMRKVKARRPHIGTPGLLISAFLIAFTIDVLLEHAWMLLGLWSWAGTIPALTLWSGHYYQFPIYEAVFFGASWAACGSLVYFVDDKGRTVVERGLDSIRATDKQKIGLRILAVAGFFNMVVFFYNVAFGSMALQPQWRWAQDVVDRSYFRNNLCGEGTPYACPGWDLPLPRGNHGSHVDPDGKLVVPPGAEERRYR
ncbi:MAG: spirocyclase AveC family protein [Actinomycetota bacterium]